MIGNKTHRCSSGACVEIQDTGDTFTFISTIEGNNGAVIYTPSEVADFLADVKAGKYDELHRDARQRAEG
jgi:hypothetical protein